MIKEYIVKVTNEVLPNAFALFEKEFSTNQELVRCEDCTYWDAKKNECHNINSYMQYRPCFKDWFCADGEKKVKQK